MGLRTSVYLADDVVAAWKASEVPLGELVRRGLSARVPEEQAALRAAEAVRDDVRASQQGLAAEAAQGTLDATEDRLRELAREIQADAVRDALRQGGGYQ